ncbi:testis-specific gene A8 protein-like [Prorops nasuta]|uniref:testis-specific gene A8 protein-like n=1 Tax=Prorops nasuta TaxID=863751 RepID=UPI0034CD0500
MTAAELLMCSQITPKYLQKINIILIKSILHLKAQKLGTLLAYEKGNVLCFIPHVEAITGARTYTCFQMKTRNSGEEAAKEEGAADRPATTSQPPAPPCPPTAKSGHGAGREKEGGGAATRTAKAGASKGPRTTPKPGGSADPLKPLRRRSEPTPRSTPKPGVVATSLLTTPKPGGSAAKPRTTPKPGVAVVKKPSGPQPSHASQPQPAAAPRIAVRGRSQEPGPSRIRTYAEAAGGRPSLAKPALTDKEIDQLAKRRRRQRRRQKKAAERAAEIASGPAVPAPLAHDAAAAAAVALPDVTTAEAAAALPDATHAAIAAATPRDAAVAPRDAVVAPREKPVVAAAIAATTGLHSLDEALAK